MKAMESAFAGKYLDIPIDYCAGNQNVAVLEQDFRALIKANPSITDEEILEAMKSNWDSYKAKTGPYSMFNLGNPNPEHNYYLRLDRPEGHALLCSFREGKTKEERLNLLKQRIEASEPFEEAYKINKAAYLMGHTLDREAIKAARAKLSALEKFYDADIPVSEMDEQQLRQYERLKSKKHWEIFGFIVFVLLVLLLMKWGSNIEVSSEDEADRWIKDNMRESGGRYYYDPKDKDE